MTANDIAAAADEPIASVTTDDGGGPTFLNIDVDGHTYRFVEPTDTSLIYKVTDGADGVGGDDPFANMTTARAVLDFLVSYICDDSCPAHLPSSDRDDQADCNPGCDAAHLEARFRDPFDGIDSTEMRTIVQELVADVGERPT